MENSVAAGLCPSRGDMIGLLWELGTCGTLSLDFPVLAEEEIVCGARPQREFRAGLNHIGRALHSGQSTPLGLEAQGGKGSPPQSGQVKDGNHPAPQ